MTARPFSASRPRLFCGAADSNIGELVVAFYGRIHSPHAPREKPDEKCRLANPYSLRRTIAGSTRVARRAGTSTASIATASNTKGVAA